MEFDYSRIKLFSYMINQLDDVNVVISSSWRYVREIDYFIGLFKRLGIVCNIIDKTPRLGYNTIRGNEIQQWLDDNKELNIDDYVIIDN